VDKVIQAQLSSMASGLRYDAFYMTRKQKERIKEGAANGSYPTIGAAFLQEKRFQDTVVMHPLPRVDELSPELDKDRRGIYFKQAAYGVPIRMALLQFLLGKTPASQPAAKQLPRTYLSPEPIGPKCHNPNCVSVNESVSTMRRFRIYFTDHIGALVLGCAYCDHRFKVDYVGNVKTKRYSAFDNALSEAIRGWWENGELALFESIKEAEELGYEPTRSSAQRMLMTGSEIASALAAMSQQILDDCRDPDRLLILGVRSVGSQLAQRIAEQIEARRRRKIELGEIEIYGAGDELRRLAPADPDLGPLSLKDREVVLVDDVIYTGRTVKSALSIIFRSGRPQSVRLAVLVDRGHREVPVKPNYVGKNIPSSESDRVRVRLRGNDRETSDRVVIYSISNAAGRAHKAPSAGREKAITQ
jgi:pyrimidine operon attenuation protein/uracil phosphoribosyltransferase